LGFGEGNPAIDLVETLPAGVAAVGLWMSASSMPWAFSQVNRKCRSRVETATTGTRGAGKELLSLPCVSVDGDHPACQVTVVLHQSVLMTLT